MKLQKLLMVSVALATASACLPLSAESINPATVPQVAPTTPQAKKNLDMVLEYVRTIIIARHVDVAAKYTAEDYIEHNPNRASGFAAFVASFGQRPPIPIPEKTQGLVVLGSKGDLVWMIHENEAKNPRNPSQTYYYNSFDMERVANGKIHEHWDGAQRGPLPSGAPPRPPIVQSPSNFGNTGKLSSQEKKNIAIATMEMKDMLQYGHLELADKVLDVNYIQHNPNVPQGREGFKQFMARVPGRTPEAIKPEWKAAPAVTIAEGPYVFMMWERKAQDPADPSQQYTWDHFDLVRIENGLVKEHWDEARIAPPSPQAKQ